MFIVPGSTSTKTGTAPRRTNAFAVETNVYDGMMTSSPGVRSSRIAASSSACVHELVRSTRDDPVMAARRSELRTVHGPSPESDWLPIASATCSRSVPTRVGQLNRTSLIGSCTSRACRA